MGPGIRTEIRRTPDKMNNQGQTTAGSQGRRQSLTQRKGLAASAKKQVLPENSGTGAPKKLALPHSPPASGERSVKKLRLSKALTIPEGTSVYDACRRMTVRRVDAALLTDHSGLLSGIITDKDVATRVIAEGLKPRETPVSKVMTRNPTYVGAESSAVEALEKMNQGKFRHLPVVEDGEVTSLLDITKCLYDAIAKMEKAAEKGSAIAAAVEGIERHFGDAPSTFIETLRERIFRPSLSTLIMESTKVATVQPSESVYMAAKKMRDFRVNSVIITSGNKPQGILTSKDLLTRIVAQNLFPESTLVEKVMTPNPECTTANTTIVDALHTMHNGKFLHLPVIDKDGFIVACLDVLQLTHAAMAMVGSTSGSGSDTASTMMQKFWDSTLTLEPQEIDQDSRSDLSPRLSVDGTESVKTGYPSLGLGNTFDFKLCDSKGRIHRFNCGIESLKELASAVVQRIGNDIDQIRPPQILYEDDEGDKVLLSTDSDLVAAVNHARQAGWKGLKLHVDSSILEDKKAVMSTDSVELDNLDLAQRNYWSSAYSAVVAGVALLAGVSIIVYLKRSSK